MNNVRSVTDRLPFLETAIAEIGDQIHGLVTGAVTSVRDQRGRGLPEGLRHGRAGALLFLAELYRQTGDQRYLSAIEASMHQALKIWINEKYADHSFMEGSMGIVYAILQLYKITADDVYLEAASVIAKRSAREYLNHPYASNSFFSGRAGIVCTLLHLHAATRSQWILELINLYIKKLIRDGDMDTRGISWRTPGGDIIPPLGFGYGASGVGYAFLELGYYLREEAFFLVAAQAFSFENAHWDDHTGNWPDYRSRAIRDAETYWEHRRNYDNGNLDFFTRHSDNTTYTSGTSGIGLTRLRAMQWMKFPATDVDRALRKVKLQDTRSNVSISDGEAGPGMFALESFRITGNLEHFDLACAIATRIHRRYATMEPVSPNGYGLFSGLAGLGYFYLQLRDPFHTPSVVLPSIHTQVALAAEVDAFPFINISVSELTKMLIQKAFPRTIYLLEHLATDALNEFCKTNTAGYITKNFQLFVRATLPALDKKQRAIAKSLFQLEEKKLALSERVESDALAHLKEIRHQEAVEKLLSLTEKELLGESLMINNEAILVRTRTDPRLNLDLEFSETLLENISPYVTAIIPSLERFNRREIRKSCEQYFPRLNYGPVKEVYLNEFQRLLLAGLDTPKSISAILARARNYFAQNETVEVERLILEQLKKDLIAGVLSPVVACA